jgi:hypothetical protein
VKRLLSTMTCGILVVGTASRPGVRWTDGWSVEAKDQFIYDVLDAYEAVIGAPGVFRFLQARIHAERRQ